MNLHRTTLSEPDKANRNQLLDVRNVTKAYGQNQALGGVNLEVARGEVVALLGENGAGKSTLAKIVCGLETPDGGSIHFAGQEVDFRSPRDAQRHGVAIIPQELAFVPDLTVAENIMLGHLPTIGPFARPEAIRRAAREQLDKINLDLPLDKNVKSLPLADIQIIEIVKALRSNVQLLVMDEPTASLTVHESERLFELIRRYTRQGAGVIFVSHHLEEVLNGTDRVYVFRDGNITANLPTRQATRAELIREMLGDTVETDLRPAASRDDSAPSVSVTNWNHSEPPLSSLSLDFFPGQISVLYGLRGCGSDTLVEGLAGARTSITGSLRLHGRAVNILSSPKRARKSGIAFVPADRRRQGLFMHQSIHDNIMALCRPWAAVAGWIRPALERKIVSEAIKKYRVRSNSAGQFVSQLSGGNQQKVLLASRLAANPSILLLQEPTRGVDVGSRDEVHRLLRNAADSGVTVVVATSDLEEAMRLGDRLVVLRDGTKVGELIGEAKVEHEALALAKGEIQ